MDNEIKRQLDRIENSPGVYIFRNGENKILYIGKAKNLRARVRSYFVSSRDSRSLVSRIVDEIVIVKTINTNSEVEAILLEAKLIKRIKPAYNARQKDDKSFIYVFINFSDPIPKVQFVRQKEVLEGRIKQKKKDRLFGPFLSALEIRKLLNYFRLIVPFRDCADSKFKRYQKLNRGCQWAEIGKCSAPCVGGSDVKEYRKNIAKLSRLLSGKIKSVKKDFVREMKRYSKEKDYEQAAEIRDKIKTLDRIKETSMIDDYRHIGIYTSDVRRGMWGCFMVEAVDISNISGRYASGAIIAAECQISNIKFLKERYRRFRIRIKDEPDDVGMMGEVIKRRFKHPEWKFPDLLIIDGGKGQLNAVESELEEIISSHPTASASNSKKINLVSIAKGPTRKGEELYFSQNFDPKLKSTLIKDKRVIKLMRDEAHRFALNYHKILRSKGIIGK